jgi:hypothetical protein
MALQSLDAFLQRAQAPTPRRLILVRQHVVFG